MADLETRVSLLEQGYEWVKDELEAAREQRDGLGTMVRQLRDSVNEMLQRDKDKQREDDRRSRRMERHISKMTLALLFLTLAVTTAGVLLSQKL